MTHGFDLTSSLVCEGIIGDGCGGGRIFFIDKHLLKVYDPITKESMVLYDSLFNVELLTKEGCILFITTKEKVLRFDISSLKILEC